MFGSLWKIILVADTLCSAWVERGLVEAENAVAVKDLLRCPKYHLIGKRMRSSTEIGKGLIFCLISQEFHLWPGWRYVVCGKGSFLRQATVRLKLHEVINSLVGC